jgi:hypothetical protein
MDLFVNDEGDVELDDRKDLTMVEGAAAIDQSIKLMVSLYFYERIGSVTAVNAVEKLELQAERVAENNQYIENVEKVTAERVTDGSNNQGGIKINVIYDTGAAYFTVGG